MPDNDAAVADDNLLSRGRVGQSLLAERIALVGWALAFVIVSLGLISLWTSADTGGLAELSEALDTRLHDEGMLAWGLGLGLVGACCFLAARVLRSKLFQSGGAVFEATPAEGAPSSRLCQELDALRDVLQELAADDIDTIQFVDTLVRRATHLGASDIHIQPAADASRVSLRLHGLLEPVIELPSAKHRPLINRLKVMTELCSYVSDRPQDGHFVLDERPTQVDVRLSLLPTNHGEKAVMRLAVGASSLPDIGGLGLSTHAAEALSGVLQHSQGLVFLTGPTGSGKTTTIYACLGQVQTLRGQTTHIATIEDPIEYDLPFLTQTQVNADVGLSFAAGLRSILRQDPNVMMVGEIRDPETARIAVQAGMTGHMILTTVHAETAAGVFNRLIDMGVEPFLVASTSIASVSQRLVRAVCSECRCEIEISPEQRARLAQLGLEANISSFAGRGCELCDQSGFAGRLPLLEVLEVSATVRDLITSKVTTSRIHEAALSDGMTPLLLDGIRRVERGETTLAEVLRVAG